MKPVVLLINLGTPDSPATADVGRYLGEFLNDKRVIDIHFLLRKALVNLIIVPFRSFRSAALYKELWTASGSPLMVNTTKLRDALRKELNGIYIVEMAMRYGKPGLENILEELEKRNTRQVILIPLYPQYASSTTGSTLEKAVNAIGKWKQVPEVRMIHHFHNHPCFIDAFASRINQYNPGSFDHLLFSYHGLPLNQVHAAHPGNDCDSLGCREKRGDENVFCYLASCHETSRLLASRLGILEEDYTVCFQSRLNRHWITPFTDETAIALAKKRIKRILVVSPSFVTDCLETVHELGIRLKKTFLQNGGEQLTLVESLNDFPEWVAALPGMINL